MNPAKTSLLAATLLVLVSSLFVLVGAEISYRFYVSLKAKLPIAPSYQAVSAPTGVYNEYVGYDYVPSTTLTMATVRDGKVAMCNQIVTNAAGNIGRTQPATSVEGLSVLVVGDSFSHNMHLNGLTWPDLMGEELEKNLSEPVRMMNYSRSGYGVLQMFSMAAHQLEKQPATLLVIPFILNDLARSRFWRTSRVQDGETRFLQVSKATTDPTMTESMDVSLVHSGITKTWCNTALANPVENDPITTSLNDRYKQLAMTYHRQIRLTRLTESFLYRRFFEKDYDMAHAHTHSLPPFQLSSYAEEPRFVSDVRKLRASGIPILLVRLPIHEELAAGAYLQGTEQEKSLLHSLEDITGIDVTEMFPVHHLPDGDLAKLYLPVDMHPSRAGAAFYAHEISRLVAPLLVGQQHPVNRPHQSNDSSTG